MNKEEKNILKNSGFTPEETRAAVQAILEIRKGKFHAAA